MQADAIIAQKSAMRRAAMERRDARVADDDPVAAADKAAEHFLRHIPIADTAIVSGYWPMGSELDVQPLLIRLHEVGRRLALPVTVGRDRPLAFRVWQPGDTLVPGGFGTSVPPPEAAAVSPDLLIVPLLAIDSDGYRLGYGGGYYDRTLKALRAEGRPIMAVGFAFEAQQVACVPHHGGDERLDWLVTELQARPYDALEVR